MNEKNNKTKKKNPKTEKSHLFHVMGRNTSAKKTVPDLIRQSFYIVLKGSVLGRLS